MNRPCTIADGVLPCHENIGTIDTLHLHSYLSRLLVERIETKAERITATHIRGDRRWEDTLFRTLARNFGFGIQGDAFEQWADILDLAALGKHRDNSVQVMAIFFGQAGLLEPESIPELYRRSAICEPYFMELQREYHFLTAKFRFKQADHKIWQSSGNSHPHTRIARLATMYFNGLISMSSIAECNTLNELRKLLQTPVIGYWSNRNHFGGTTTIGKSELLSTKHINLLIINTIAPMLYAYGKHRQEPVLCGRAEEFLHDLPPEENGIIRGWAKMGVNVSCAADTQALIQLKKEYCNKKRCNECHIAQLLQNNQPKNE